MRGIALTLWILLSVLVGSPVCYGEVIEIAAIYALTGSAAQANAPSIQGVRAAVDEINKRGGLLGREVALNLVDNQSTPIGSHLAAQQVAASNAVAIIGAAWSNHSLPIARVAQEHGIPMISNYSTNVEVTRTGDYIFRVCFTDTFQGNALAQFARKDLAARTATVFVNLNSEYSIGLSRIFKQNFELAGGEVILEVEYKARQESFNKQIHLAKDARADVLFLSGHDESGWIARLAQDSGVQSIPLGGDGWSVPSFLTKGGGHLKRGYYCSHWSESVASERAKAFVMHYQDSPSFGTGMALAYDAVMVLADAIRRAGSCERSKIRDALAETRSFEGVTGTISFDAQGDPIKSVVIMEIKDGKPSYLKTLEPAS